MFYIILNFIILTLVFALIVVVFVVVYKKSFSHYQELSKYNKKSYDEFIDKLSHHSNEDAINKVKNTKICVQMDGDSLNSYLYGKSKIILSK